MNIQAARKVIEDLEDAFVKASRNTICLYPGCSDTPIGSHVIARKTLKLIADKGHVFTWLTRKVSAWDMAKTIDAGKPLEQLNEEPVSVGIGDVKKVTNPLFCHDHDERVFAPLEKGEFSFQPEQVVLVAYRALCSMTCSAPPTDAILKVAKQHGYQHSLSTPERFSKLQRFQAVDIVLKARQRYEQIHKAQDYNQLVPSHQKIDR